MKVFAFDPKTGAKGELLYSVPRPTWASNRSEIDCVIPVVHGQEWTCHEDAGYMGKDGKDVSLKVNRWICFCSGPMHCGNDSWWEWVILPPVVK